MMPTHRRILFAAEFGTGTTGIGLAQGLRTAGWAVHEVDNREYMPRLHSRAARALLRTAKFAFVSSYNEAIKIAARQLQPDIFLTVKGSYIAPSTLSELKQMNVLLSNFYPDRDFDRADIDKSTLQFYDVFSTTKPYQLDYLKTILGEDKVFYVPHGYCDVTHAPRIPEHLPALPHPDVLYVGNYALSKERWLSALARILPDVNMQIVGFAWDRNKSSELNRHILGYGLTADNYARAVQSAQINIALHGDIKYPEGWMDYVSTRTFEIPACKGFMLHVDNPEIRELFEVGKEIDVFTTANELAEKVQYYLERPHLRHLMIEAAYARCVPNYGYAARAAELSSLFLRRLKESAIN